MPSVLLSHSRQNSDDNYFFTYVRPATDLELSRIKSDPDGFPVSHFADSKKKTVFIDNPILTDVTQVVHTDIHSILSNNPDVSGLSLILDDPAANQLRDSVSFEDFVEPSQYVDIFDVQDFVENAKRSFTLLPASLRKQFNNDPFALVNAIEKNDTRAVSLLRDYLGIDSDLNSSGEAKAPSSVSDNTKTKDDAVAPPSFDNSK